MNLKNMMTKGGLVTGALLVFATSALPDTLNFNFIYTCATASTCVSGESNNGTYLTGFVGALNGGSITATGGNGTGGAFVTLSGGANTYLELTSITGSGATQTDVFTLYGTLTSGANTFSGTLLTITEAASTVSGSVINFGAVTSLNNVNASLATFLGISTNNNAALVGTDKITPFVNGSTTPYTSTATTPNGAQPASTGVQSATYSISATPEPASFLLFGTGLLCVGLVSRRRRNGKNNS